MVAAATGASVGSVVGFATGSEVGSAAGAVVGLAIGTEVGSATGLDVRLTTGDFVGAAIGASVGVLLRSIGLLPVIYAFTAKMNVKGGVVDV